MKFAPIVLTGILAVSLTRAENTPQSPEPAAKSVLLAYEQTDFKKTLIDEMAAQLRNASVTVKVIEHSKGALDKEDPAGYDAIFISNSGVQSKVRPWITDWISRQNAHSSRIILHTTQTKNWTVNVPVDAVTSASAKKDSKKLATEYTARIQKVLDAPVTDDQE